MGCDEEAPNVLGNTSQVLNRGICSEVRLELRHVEAMSANHAGESRVEHGEGQSFQRSAHDLHCVEGFDAGRTVCDDADRSGWSDRRHSCVA